MQYLPSNPVIMTEFILPILLLVGATLAHAQTRSTPLAVGDAVPDVTLRTQEGTEVELRNLVAKKPTVLIFYRGGWCPFCTRHLQALVGIDVNTDYRTRLEPAKVLEAAKGADRAEPGS